MLFGLAGGSISRNAGGDTEPGNMGVEEVVIILLEMERVVLESQPRSEGILPTRSYVQFCCLGDHSKQVV